MAPKQKSNPRRIRAQRRTMWRRARSGAGSTGEAARDANPSARPVATKDDFDRFRCGARSRAPRANVESDDSEGRVLRRALLGEIANVPRCLEIEQQVRLPIEDAAHLL